MPRARFYLVEIVAMQPHYRLPVNMHYAVKNNDIYTNEIVIPLLNLMLLLPPFDCNSNLNIEFPFLLLF